MSIDPENFGTGLEGVSPKARRRDWKRRAIQQCLLIVEGIKKNRSNIEKNRCSMAMKVLAMAKNQNFRRLSDLLLSAFLYLSTYQKQGRVGTGGSIAPIRYLRIDRPRKASKNHPVTMPNSFTSTLWYLSSNIEAGKVKRSDQIEFSCIWPMRGAVLSTE